MTCASICWFSRSERSKTPKVWPGFGGLFSVDSEDFRHCFSGPLLLLNTIPLRSACVARAMGLREAGCARKGDGAIQQTPGDCACGRGEISCAVPPRGWGGFTRDAIRVLLPSRLPGWRTTATSPAFGSPGGNDSPDISPAPGWQPLASPSSSNRFLGAGIVSRLGHWHARVGTQSLRGGLLHGLSEVEESFTYLGSPGRRAAETDRRVLFFLLW